jgi:hypothetical protein
MKGEIRKGLVIHKSVAFSPFLDGKSNFICFPFTILCQIIIASTPTFILSDYEAGKTISLLRVKFIMSQTKMKNSSAFNLKFTFLEHTYQKRKQNKRENVPIYYCISILENI